MATELKLTLADGERAQRKTLITVAEWGGTFDSTGKYTGTTIYRELLGTRTEDSSLEFNADSETSTDVRGNNYTDVNKTEPQQDFDPFYVMGGSNLSAYLTKAALKNDIDAYNNQFNIYIITAFINASSGSGDSATTQYYAVRHKGCTIIPTSIGGDTRNSMPIEVHLSNNLVEGTVNALKPTFTFTEASDITITSEVTTSDFSAAVTST